MAKQFKEITLLDMHSAKSFAILAILAVLIFLAILAKVAIATIWPILAIIAILRLLPFWQFWQFWTFWPFGLFDHYGLFGPCGYCGRFGHIFLQIDIIWRLNKCMKKFGFLWRSIDCIINKTAGYFRLFSLFRILIKMPFLYKITIF